MVNKWESLWAARTQETPEEPKAPVNKWEALWAARNSTAIQPPEQVQPAAPQAKPAPKPIPANYHQLPTEQQRALFNPDLAKPAGVEAARTEAKRLGQAAVQTQKKRLGKTRPGQPKLDSFRATVPAADRKKVEQGVRTGDIEAGTIFRDADGQLYQVFTTPDQVSDAKEAQRFRYSGLPGHKPKGQDMLHKYLDIGTYTRQVTAKEEQTLADQMEKLAFARRRLEESRAPNVKATLVGGAANAVGLGQRLTGLGDADETLRFGNAFGQAAAERDDKGVVPAFIKRGLRGVGQTLPLMIVGGAAGGPYGAIGAATATEANQAITTGRDAGLSGRDLANYAVSEGVTEALPAVFMQKIGLGGLEKAFGKQGMVAANRGTMAALKRAGIRTLEELPEELVTELGHSVNQVAKGVDPKATSPDQLYQTFLDTTVQTLMTMGLMEAPNIAAAQLEKKRGFQKQQPPEVEPEQPTVPEEAPIEPPVEQPTEQQPPRDNYLRRGAAKTIAKLQQRREAEAAVPGEVQPKIAKPAVVPKKPIEDEREGPAVKEPRTPSGAKIAQDDPVVQAGPFDLHQNEYGGGYTALPRDTEIPTFAAEEEADQAIDNMIDSLAEKYGMDEVDRAPIGTNTGGFVDLPTPQSRLTLDELVELRALHVARDRLGAGSRAAVVDTVVKQVGDGPLSQNAVQKMVDHLYRDERLGAALHPGYQGDPKKIARTLFADGLHKTMPSDPIFGSDEHLLDTAVELIQRGGGEQYRPLLKQVAQLITAVTGQTPAAMSPAALEAPETPPEAAQEPEAVPQPKIGRKGVRKKPAAPAKPTEAEEKPLPATKAGLIDEIFGERKPQTLDGIKRRRRLSGMKKAELEDLVRDQRRVAREGKQITEVADQVRGGVQQIADAAGKRWMGAVNDHLKSLGLRPVPRSTKGEMIAIAARKIAESGLSEKPEAGHATAFRAALGDDYANRHGEAFDRYFREFDTLDEDAKNREYRSNERRGVSFQSELGAKVTYAGTRVGLREDGMRNVLRAIQEPGAVSKPEAAPKKKLDAKKATPAAPVSDKDIEAARVMGIKYAHKLAKQKGVDQDTLESAVGLAVTNARDSYVPGGDAKFSTYAMKAVKNEIVDAIKNEGPTAQQFPEGMDVPAPPQQSEAEIEATEAVEETRAKTIEKLRKTNLKFRHDYDFHAQWAKKGRKKESIAARDARIRYEKILDARPGLREKAEGLEEAQAVSPGRQARRDFMDSVGRFGELLRESGRLGAVYDPKQVAEQQLQLAKQAADVVAKAIKAGVTTFTEFLRSIDAAYSPEVAAKMSPHLRDEWEKQQGPIEPTAETEGLPEITSIKNRIVEELRAGRDMPGVESIGLGTFQGWLDQAQMRMEAEPDWIVNLTAELQDNRRAVSHLEHAGMQIQYRKVNNQLGEAVDSLSSARADGDPASIASAQATLRVVQNNLEAMEEASRLSGTRAGQALVARKMELLADYSLAALTAKAQAAKGGTPLTAEESIKLKEMADRIAQLEAQLAKRSQSESESRVDRTLDKIRKGRKGISKKRKAVTDKPPAASADDPSSIRRLAEWLARKQIAAGVTARDAIVDAVHQQLQAIVPGISQRQTMDAISGYGVWSELSKDEISAKLRILKGEYQQLAKLEDMQQGRAPLKTGREHREASDEERRLIKLVNEAKKKGGFTVTDPEKQLRSALDAAKTAAKNRIADLSHEIQTREKIVRNRTQITPDAELTALHKQRDALLAEWKKIFPPEKKPLTDAQRLKMLESALDRQITQLEGDLAVGRIDIKAPLPKLTSPEVSAKRARLEELKAQREELRANNPEYQAKLEQRQNEAYRKLLKNRIADYRQRIDEGDFTPKKKLDRKLDKETLDLKYEVEQEKQKFQGMREAWKRAQRPMALKVLGGVAGVANTSRAILTSMDASAVLRQGGWIAYGHPGLVANGLGPMFQAITRKGEYAVADQLSNHPLRPLADRAGLSLTVTEGAMSRQEEIFMGNLLEHAPRWTVVAPAVRASERLYVTFLNYLRMTTFAAMAEKLGRNGEVSIAEATVLANYVNAATGRGWLGKRGELSASALAQVFFSPRFFVSRFQLLLGQPLWTFKAKNAGRARAVIAKEYARSLSGMGLFYGSILTAAGMLWPGGDEDDERPFVEFDPRSSDFLKIRIGNTRIDPLMGLSQSAVFLSRLATGERKRTTTGEIIPTREHATLSSLFSTEEPKKVPYGQPHTSDIIWWFQQSKFSPWLSTSLDLLDLGKTKYGKEVTLASEARDFVVPIVLQDAYDAMKDQGMAKGAALTLAAMFGWGLQTYSPRVEKAKPAAKPKLWESSYKPWESSYKP